MALLVVLFLALPFVEIYVIVQVAHVIGALDTVVALAAISLAGAWLVKREGMSTFRRGQAQVRAGHVPGDELVDGLMILLAGALLVTPGFVTDALGLVLLVPPVRYGVRRAARAWLHRSALRHAARAGPPARRGPGASF